jgi:hypothetical protein
VPPRRDLEILARAPARRQRVTRSCRRRWLDTGRSGGSERTERLRRTRAALIALLTRTAARLPVDGQEPEGP